MSTPFKYLVCQCGYKKTDPSGKGKCTCKNCGSAMYLSENWYSRVTHNGVTKVHAHSPRKRDAEDFIAACKIAKRSGTLLPGEEKDITWKDAKENCEKWWAQDMEQNLIRQSTADFYKFMLVPLGHFEGKSLLTITKEMISDYMNDRRKEVSLTTVSRELSALKRIYSMHIERLEMEERPKLMAKAMIISKIKPPKVDNDIERFCEIVEVKSVFKTIEDNKKSKEIDRKRTRLGIMLGVGLGLRPFNICSLEWKEVNFKTGTINIPGNKMKNKKPYTSGLPATIADELQAWRKSQKVLSRYVFPSPKDASKPIQNMRTAINRAIREANLNPEGVERKQKVTPYVLTRHTFASQALMFSGNLTAVSDQLHHSDSKVTKKRYAKVNVDYKKESIGQYEEAVLKRMVE